MCRFHKKCLPSSENCAIIIYTACAAYPNTASPFCTLLPAQFTPLTGTKTLRRIPRNAGTGWHNSHPSRGRKLIKSAARAVMSAPAQFTPLTGTKTSRLPSSISLFRWHNSHPSRGRKLRNTRIGLKIRSAQFTPLTGTKTNLWIYSPHSIPAQFTPLTGTKTSLSSQQYFWYERHNSPPHGSETTKSPRCDTRYIPETKIKTLPLLTSAQAGGQWQRIFRFESGIHFRFKRDTVR